MCACVAFHSYVIHSCDRCFFFDTITSVLLENSPVLCSTGRSLSCERSSDLQEIKLTESCISDALQKTSQAIRDINTLLSEQHF